MATEILSTPLDAYYGMSEDYHFDTSSPPSSPSNLTNVDSSPPDSPSLLALQVNDSDDEMSEGSEQMEGLRTTPKQRGKEVMTGVDLSPAHPYAASTRADKRPALYDKDSTRSKLKRPRVDFDLTRDTLSDSTNRTLVFGLDRSSLYDGPNTMLAHSVLGDAINLAGKASAAASNGLLFSAHCPSGSEREMDIWDEAIAKATMDNESIIDLTQKNLSFIPKTICDLSKRVILDHEVSPVRSRPLSRVWSRSTSHSALGQRDDDIQLHVGGNHISRLPAELFKVNALVVLSLRGNMLTELPPDICNLRNLRELNVANNRLRYLPAEISRLDLQVLTVDPNPFLENPYAGKDWTKERDKSRWFGPVTRRMQVPSLFEFALRVLLSPAPHSDRLSSLQPQGRRVTVLESMYDLPIPRDVSPLVYDIFSTCVPGSVATSPQYSAKDEVPHSSISTCMSQRHFATISNGESSEPVFVDHVEEMFTWEKYVAGKKAGGDFGIPLRWRGCSAQCLAFLTESIGEEAHERPGKENTGDEWTVGVETEFASKLTVADIEPSVLNGTSLASQEFGYFSADDIDLDV